MPRASVTVAVKPSKFPLLRRKEAAARLGVHPQTVIALVKRKLLAESRQPSARGFRSMPRYRVEDLEAYRASGFVAGLQ